VVGDVSVSCKSSEKLGSTPGPQIMSFSRFGRSDKKITTSMCLPDSRSHLTLQELLFEEGDSNHNLYYWLPSGSTLSS